MRHSECTRTSTSSSPAISPLTIATWCLSSTSERKPTTLEVAELGRQPRLDHALDQLVVPAPVGDQVGDGDHLQPVLRAVALEVGHARHRAVVVHHLADHAGRVEAREPREVHGRLGLPGALEHAAVLRLQREDVAGLDEVVRPRARVDRHLDRVRAVVRRDAGGDPLARLDRDGERGLERRLVLRRHQVEAELVAALAGEREADQAAPVRGHEVDRVGRDELGRHREVALVLAVLRVADHDHPALADVLDGLLDRAEGRVRHRALSFSTYLARMSTSRLTVRPGRGGAQRRALERLGDQRHLEGLSSTPETVRDTPSTAMDPFSTT